MQQTYNRTPATRKRGIAFSSSLLFAILAGLIIFSIGILTSFHAITGDNNIAIALLIAIFGMPFLAGLIGTLRSGRIGTGMLAGLWTGVFVGIFLGIYILLLYFNNAPQTISPQIIQQMHDLLAQRGIDIPLQNLQVGSLQQTTLSDIAIADGILILLLLVIGAFVGLISALIGKIFAPRPRDYIAPPRYY